ncbi:hypothetical protein [Nonomuraea aridisoli]|uniref:Uncharacterized protein n=1 Tax=Nonomuraea aridisoli TaxID=2070368 RepID=A0A2W2F4F6_9ACTN|nr:hypothetical protein [Nonomuraea aridisoli]PZG20630.1 hypothetical protein C1J01_09005 [Nonomuraea aridisoli]
MSPAQILSEALHATMCERAAAGGPLMPPHGQHAADIMAQLTDAGVSVVHTGEIAYADQVYALLRDVADELGERGRIGRTLLNGSYPTGANVARQELLDRIANLRGGRRV